ncbi:MAG: spore cortex biosynthesis protein YabQ [Peptococcaceae bacterium]|nr:spore cortex biosynthesis protein YabQ [Candidatus Syntrophopropionicum ammoniitolerans]
MESLLSQARAFFMIIAIGIIAAVGFDYYRAVRRAFKLKRAGIFLGDIIFWLVTTVIVFTLLILANWGEMRLYVFLGLGLGVLLYFCLFSKPVSRLIWIKFYILYRIWQYFVLVVSYIWRAVLAPFRLVIMLVSYPFQYCRLLFIKLGRKLRAVGKKLVTGPAKHCVAAVKRKISRIFRRKPKQ